MAVANPSDSVIHRIHRPLWLTRLLKDCEAEGEFEAKWPIILLEGQQRNALWCMCLELEVEKHGVPGHACRMLESYLARYFRQNSFLSTDTAVQALPKRFILLMATCIRLATKMSTSSLHMNAGKIRRYLETKSFIYSQQQVSSAETEVYQMLLFNIPLWTSVEAGLMMGNLILKMPASTLSKISVVVDLCELNRNDLARNFKKVNGPSVLLTLHLTAGAVLASHHFYNDDRQDYTAKLAVYTGIHSDHLRSLVNIIIVLTNSLEQVEDMPPLKKKKRN